METSALVAIVGITVALIEGGIGLIKFLINKYTKKESDVKMDIVLGKLEKIGAETERTLDMHNRYDSDGTPLWYVPRSWVDTQKEIVDRLHVITETNMKMLGIIERLERRIDNHRSN